MTPSPPKAKSDFPGGGGVAGWGSAGANLHEMVAFTCNSVASGSLDRCHLLQTRAGNTPDGKDVDKG